MRGAAPNRKAIQYLTIYDAKGGLVYSKNLYIIQPYQLEKVDMRRNVSGIYYVVLRNAEGEKIKSGKVLIK